MNGEIVVTRNFQADLTNKEYVAVRVNVAKKCMALKDWIAEAIREKLEKIKEDNEWTQNG